MCNIVGTHILSLSLVSHLSNHLLCDPIAEKKKRKLFPEGSKCVCMCVCTQLCVTLCDPMDYSPPGSSVHGIFQARILEWVAIFFSRGSSLPRDWTCVSLMSPALAGGFFTNWEALKGPCSVAAAWKPVYFT